MSTRTETDSPGSIEIDDAPWWGPQTERTLRLFRTGEDRFPRLMIRAVRLQKQAAAEANDIRLPGSGPRAGIGKLVVPADGFSSSIMPGKTKPTQCEALTMVANQVVGNHVAITIGAAQSFLELNVFKPLIIHNVLASARLLGDAAASFAANMADRLEPARDRIAENLARSLMLVTAPNPRIGYDKVVGIAKAAVAENLTLRETAIRSGHLTGEEFDRRVRPGEMARPSIN